MNNLGKGMKYGAGSKPPQTPPAGVFKLSNHFQDNLKSLDGKKHTGIPANQQALWLLEAAGLIVGSQGGWLGRGPVACPAAVLHNGTSGTSVGPTWSNMQEHSLWPGHPETPVSFPEPDMEESPGPAQDTQSAHQLLLVETCLPRQSGTLCIHSFVHSLNKSPCPLTWGSG